MMLLGCLLLRGLRGQLGTARPAGGLLHYFVLVICMFRCYVFKYMSVLV